MNGILSAAPSPSRVARISAADFTSTTSPGRRALSSSCVNESRGWPSCRLFTRSIWPTNGSGGPTYCSKSAFFAPAPFTSSGALAQSREATRKARRGGALIARKMDLEVIIVSHRDGRWLQPCVGSLESGAGACSYRKTIVENGGAWPLPLPETPTRRVLQMENLGFGAANNAGARGSAADLLLFLNPDTELVDGTLELLVASMRDRPRAGLLAVRQVTSDGELWPSLHRFPSVPQGAGAGAWRARGGPVLGKRLGERVLEPDRYAREGRFDWTTGAVLAVRREAFEAVGGFDERFFLFSEETDLCKRIQDERLGGALRAADQLRPSRRQGGRRSGRVRRSWPTRACSTRASTSRRPASRRLPRSPADSPPAAVRAASIPRAHAIVECAGFGAGAPRPARQVRAPVSPQHEPTSTDAAGPDPAPIGPRRSWACPSTGSTGVPLARARRSSRRCARETVAGSSPRISTSFASSPPIARAAS